MVGAVAQPPTSLQPSLSQPCRYMSPHNRVSGTACGAQDPGNLEGDLQAGTTAGYRLCWVLMWSTAMVRRWAAVTPCLPCSGSHAICSQAPLATSHGLVTASRQQLTAAATTRCCVVHGLGSPLGGLCRSSTGRGSREVDGCEPPSLNPKPVVVHAAGVPAADAVRQARGGDGQEPGAAVQARMGRCLSHQEPVYVIRSGCHHAAQGKVCRAIALSRCERHVRVCYSDPSWFHKSAKASVLLNGFSSCVSSSVHPVRGSIAENLPTLLQAGVPCGATHCLVDHDRDSYHRRRHPRGMHLPIPMPWYPNNRLGQRVF